jgi:hypothetical protein
LLKNQWTLNTLTTRRVFFQLRVRQAARQVICSVLSLIVGRATRGLEPQARLRRTLLTLRRFPYWISGHLQVAKLQLDLGSVRAGYSAATLVLASEIATPAERQAAYSLLGRSLLAAGRPAEALSAFGYPGPQLQDQDLEDIAAALMALQRHAEAKELLLKIRGEDLSQPGRAALEFLRTRVE